MLAKVGRVVFEHGKLLAAQFAAFVAIHRLEAFFETRNCFGRWRGFRSWWCLRSSAGRFRHRALQMLVKPRDLQRGRLLETLAIDAVVGDAFDDVILRRHAACGDLALGFGDDFVVAQFLVLRDDEERGHGNLRSGFEGAEADALGRVRPHVRVFFHLAGHLARFERHRLGLAACLLRVQFVGGS